MSKRAPKSFRKKAERLFKLGDRVRIIDSISGSKGPIVELRGALGPRGEYGYRVRVSRWPKTYIDVIEPQLELLPPKRVITSEAMAEARKIFDGLKPEIKAALRKQIREEMRVKRRGY